MHCKAFLTTLALLHATSAAPTDLAKRQRGGFPSWPGFPGSGGSSGGGSSENDIDSGVCRDVSVIYARGTSEPGNVGYSTGPSFFKALRSQLGADRVAVQGVAYPASVAGNANQGRDGAGTMVQQAQKAVTQCPSTKVVLSGYSQGAMVVHAAAKQLSTSLASQVAAVVTFGDPQQRQAVANIPADRVKIICHADDSVCRGSPTISSGHLNYASDAPAAASFVASKI